MLVDSVSLIQWLNDQIIQLNVFLSREAVQRQVFATIVVLLLAWLVTKLIDTILAHFDPEEERKQKPEPTEGQELLPEPPSLDRPTTPRDRIIHVLRAADYVLLPALTIALLGAVAASFAGYGWPAGLIESIVPVFWLFLFYRIVVGFVLVALPKEQAARVNKRYVRPVLFLLLLMILRGILFTTLALNDIAILQIQEMQFTLSGMLNALIAFLVFFILGWLVYSLVRHLLGRTMAEPGVISTVSTISRYAVIALGLVSALGILGVDLSTLAWITTGLTVGIGFGLQELFGNFASGIVLTFERSVRPGDIIDASGQRGVVTNVGMRSTILKTPDNVEIFVPNKELLTKPVHAFTYSDRSTRVKLNIGLEYGIDIKRAEEIMLETVTRHPMILSVPPPDLILLELGPYSIDFLVWGYVREFSESYSVRSELYQMMHDALNRNGFSIPFPRQDLMLLKQATDADEPEQRTVEADTVAAGKDSRQKSPESMAVLP